MRNVGPIVGEMPLFKLSLAGKVSLKAVFLLSVKLQGDNPDDITMTSSGFSSKKKKPNQPTNQTTSQTTKKQQHAIVIVQNAKTIS